MSYKTGKSLVEAQEDWEECNITFLHSYKTFNLARKAAILASEDKPIDSNIETNYEKPRKHKLPARFIQSSDDDDWELENMHTKRKYQVAKGSRREMEYMKNERYEKRQNIYQKNSVPAPAIKIREQLAALKNQFPIKALKCHVSNSNTKKVLTVKKPIKITNDKMPPTKSLSKEILNTYEKSSVQNSNAADLSIFGYKDLNFNNLFQSPIDSEDMTSGSEMQSMIQTDTGFNVSPILHELGREEKQDEIFQSSEHSDDIQNCEEQNKQQDLDNRESSVRINAIKSSLDGSDDFSCQKKVKRNGNRDMSQIIDDIFKVQEKMRIKLDHLDVIFDHLDVKFDRIINKLFPDEIKLQRPHGIPAFPLRTEEEWEKQEEILANDDAFT